jgi:hypothetical protein
MDIPNDQPITGFALFADGALHLQRGYGQQQFQPCRPDELPANDFKALLWVIEAALGACHNELQQTEPDSINSLLRVMALCLCTSNRPPDPVTGAVMTWVRPYPIATCSDDDAQPSGRGLCQPVARLLPKPSLRPRAHAAGVARLGGVPEAGGFAVA